jgi:dipeptidyl-peptidase-4
MHYLMDAGRFAGTFVLQLDTYRTTPSTRPSAEEQRIATPQVVKRWRWSWPDLMETRSPDGRWLLGMEAFDLRLRSTTDGRVVRLTSDGLEGHEWLMGFDWGVGSGSFSPDSRKLAVARADTRRVPRFPITYYRGDGEEVEWVQSPKAGQPMPNLELYVMDIPSRQRVRIDTGERSDQRISIVGWLPDGSELLLRREDRTRRRVELLAADPSTGDTRTILGEEGRSGFVTLVADGRQFLWASERDGWNHLYVYDLDGALIRRLTSGAFPIVAGAHMTVPERAVVAVDETAGWVYLRAQGDPERPYDVHAYRVKLDGSGFERLTEEPGFHDIQFSPAKEFFLDTHSSLARPPRTELRRADGTLLQTVARAGIEAAAAQGLVPPEEFTVKAADGVTDLYGALFLPPDFDPNSLYPVIEYIYAGPWTTIGPRRFDDFTVHEARWLAGMGIPVTSAYSAARGAGISPFEPCSSRPTPITSASRTRRPPTPGTSGRTTSSLTWDSRRPTRKATSTVPTPVWPTTSRASCS